jgi:hypothetical protein
MALRILLHFLGALLAVASRASDRFRRAITRDLVFEISTEDGVAHHFVFRGRRVSSHSGKAPAADCRLRFASASRGLRTLVSRHTVSQLLNGVVDGTIVIEGNAFHLLWFYEMTQRVVPLAERVSFPTPPGAYVAPSTTAAWAKRITREPVATALDPAWEGAVRQRAKLKMMRVAAGEPTLEF